jgi:hypothetical protein
MPRKGRQMPQSSGAKGKAHEQAIFTEALFRPGSEVPASVARHANGSPSTRRFDVYRNNVVSSLVSVLEAGFSVTRQLVGDEFFRAMAGEFVRNHRPKTAVLFEYGAEFPEFLVEFPPAQGVYGLTDCARVEQARRDVYHAADWVACGPDRLGAIPPDTLPHARFRLTSALRLLRLEHPAGTIWQRHQLMDSQPDLTRLPTRGEDVLVYRSGLDVEVRVLEEGQLAFLLALTSDSPLSEAVALATEGTGSFDLAQSMALLLETGIISGIDTQTRSHIPAERPQGVV